MKEYYTTKRMSIQVRAPENNEKGASHKRQTLPPVLQYVGWISFKFLDQLLVAWNVISFMLLSSLFPFSQPSEKCVTCFQAPISWPGHLLIERVECKNTDRLSLPFSHPSPPRPLKEAAVPIPHTWKYQILKRWSISMKCLLTWDYCAFGKSPTCFLLHFLRSYPHCILGLYLDKASGIGFTSLAALSEQLFY